jgi:hypothetical protein
VNQQEEQRLEDRLTTTLGTIRMSPLPELKTDRQRARYLIREMEYWGFTISAGIVVETPVAIGRVVPYEERKAGGNG